MIPHTLEPFLQSETPSHTSSLSDLVRLRNDSEITAEEFELLKHRLIYGGSSAKEAVVDATNARPIEPEGQSNVFSLSIVVIAIAALIYADNARGGIFPDDLYCAVGAGTAYWQGGRTEATSWSANNGCNASRPECATRWTSTPASSHCSHGTLWEAIRTKFHGILA